MIEFCDQDQTLLALAWKMTECRSGLSFLGERSAAIQVGTFRYQSGTVMRDHAHIERPRTIKKTQEALIVLQGSCAARIYGKDLRSLAGELVLGPGDMLIVYDGGVGYTVEEDDTVMVEIKAGDYLVENDSEDRVLLTRVER